MGCRNSPAFLLSKLFINVIARISSSFRISGYPDPLKPDTVRRSDAGLGEVTLVTPPAFQTLDRVRRWEDYAK
jgi:hypothetical protein